MYTVYIAEIALKLFAGMLKVWVLLHVAQLVQHLPRTQNIAGSSPARGSSSFSLEKELSSGVVACICLVSITDYSCVLSQQMQEDNVLLPPDCGI